MTKDFDIGAVVAPGLDAVFAAFHASAAEALITRQNALRVLELATRHQVRFQGAKESLMLLQDCVCLLTCYEDAKSAVADIESGNSAGAPHFLQRYVAATSIDSWRSAKENWIRSAATRGAVLVALENELEMHA